MKSITIVFGLLAGATALTAQQYTISTVAGIGTVQNYFGDGGPATSAQLDFPFKVAVDAKGDFVLADFYTFVVRQVVGGTINTIAGNAMYGYTGDGGPGAQAMISYVHGLAYDPGGNVYIADTSNHVVRIVNPTGNIYTFAGNGMAGYAGDGGKATAAELNSPAGVASDSAGNIYISDYQTHTVRKVDTKGNITTVAGTGTYGYSGDGGPAAKATLAGPVALAVDSASNIYIADPANLNVREVTADGNIHTVVSNMDVESIAVDSAGSIYFPNYQNSTIQKILTNGTQFTIAGTGTPGFSGDGGPATSAQLNQPWGIAVDKSGNVYVADFANMAIRLLTPVSSSITVANSASGLGMAIAPGEMVAIYGTNLGPSVPASQQPASDGSYGTQLAGTSVSFNGVKAPILYTSPTQIDAIVPYAMANTTLANVSVNYQGQGVGSTNMPVVSVNPGIFTANGTGIGQALALNQDYTVNSMSNPAKQGSVISLYVTGEGPTNPPGVDGKPTPLPPAPPYIPMQPMSVYLSGQFVQILWAAEEPGVVAGVMQMNVRIPTNLIQTAGTGPVAIPVIVVIGSSFTNSNVTIAVAP